MTTITIDNVIHEEANLTDDQKMLVQELQINQNAITLMNHQLDCLRSVGTVKLSALRSVLESDTTKTKKKKSNAKST